MHDLGISYAMANQVYDTMVRVFEDGIVAGSVIRLGRLGAVVPVVRPPREIRMGFRVGKGRKITKTSRIYNLDSRLCFTFKLYEKFVETHSLHWFDTQQDTSV